MKKSNSGNIIKITIYAVLIAACVAVFIIFGKKQNKPAYKPNEESTADQPGETGPVPASCSELTAALKQSGIPCASDSPVINDDGNMEYGLVFENEKDEGCIIIKPDKDFNVFSCEIRLSYFYDGIPPEGEINRVLMQEYERREKLHKALIKEYLRTVIPVLDYKDSVNSADVPNICDNIIKAYMDTGKNAKSYDRSYGVLRFNTYKGTEKPRGTFIIVVTVKGR